MRNGCLVVIVRFSAFRFALEYMRMLLVRGCVSWVGVVFLCSCVAVKSIVSRTRTFTSVLSQIYLYFLCGLDP